MTVYVVHRRPLKYGYIIQLLGVFSSEEAARAAVPNYPKGDDENDYWIDTWEVDIGMADSEFVG